jgi:DNA-binding MarR family transcriptional regulator
MDINPETMELAARFMRVLGTFFKASQQKPPHDVVGRLHFNQLHALFLLHQEPGLSQKDIADRLEITPAAVSTAIREMETMGLLQRQPDEEDARQMRLFLCPHGREVVEEGYAMRRNAVAQLLSAMPLDEQRMVVEALERALAAHDINTNRNP